MALEVNGIPVSFDLRSGVFTQGAIQCEIAGMKTNSAFLNEMKQISGKLPGALGGGTFNQFLITDDVSVWIEATGTSGVIPGKAGMGVHHKGTYVIYLNPKQSFQGKEGRTLTVAETLAHEFEHATDAGLKETADPLANNIRSHGPVAWDFEETFDKAHIPPLTFGGYDPPAKDRNRGEPAAYLFPCPPQ